MRLRDLKDQLDAIEVRQNQTVERLNAIDERLNMHERNHHGAKSKIFQGIPWSIFAILASALLQILSGGL